MKTSTTLMAACAVLYSVFWSVQHLHSFIQSSIFLTSTSPVGGGPLPEIHAEGRQFNSRFAPVARPVFPRSYYDNVTSTPTFPGPTAYKRSYPAGPTASAYVFHDKHFEKKDFVGEV